MRLPGLILAALGALSLMGCAGTTPPESTPKLRPVPPLGNDVDTCDDAKANPSPAASGRVATPQGELRGWVVLAYTLNGTRKPLNVRVVDSEPKGELVSGALQSLAHIPFKAVTKDLCVEIVTVYRRPY